MNQLPKAPFIGKIIIFRQHSGQMKAAAASTKDMEWWLNEYQDAPDNIVLDAIHLLPKMERFDAIFGFHREIPHEGEVLGGAIAFHNGEKFFLNSYSQAYGSLSKRLVEKVLAPIGVPLVLGFDII